MGSRLPDLIAEPQSKAAMAAELFESAPEICVEVLSPSNDPGEIEAKITPYFEAGAQEVWICDDAGGMRFLDAEGTLGASRLLPDFPLTIELL